MRGLLDPIAELETRVERSILKGLHGGCTLPLGVLCEANTGVLRVTAFLGLARDREANKREWIGFHHFAAQHADEFKLVENTVSHFKELVDANQST
jgi:porphobilinogen deaminase